MSEPKPQPICRGCHKTPAELEEYNDPEVTGEFSPDEYVRAEEGTYNPETGGFLCTDCYIAAGMPSNAGGWMAP